ncbi:MAG: AAA family ATPase [Blastocatellia bacterium]|nr:AAA family ATPase [Blastocatellia bacterium]
MQIFSFDSNFISYPVELNPNSRLLDNGGNLAGVLDQLRDKEPEKFELLNQEVNRLLPEYDRILFDTPDTGQRSFLLRTTRGKHKVQAEDLSTGTLFALAILTLAYIPDHPPLICIEEPDHGIHPRLLRDLQDALYRLSYPESVGEKRDPIQIICTTHSPYFLDLFRDHPEEVVIASKKDGFVTFERLSERFDIESYKVMKVAILSESEVDEAFTRIIVSAILGEEIEKVEYPLRFRGWYGVLQLIPTVIKSLYYQTDAEAFAIVVDSDETLIHNPSHEQTIDSNCRLCQIKKVIEQPQNSLALIPNRSKIKTAVGLAVPAIEAWYQCGIDAPANRLATDLSDIEKLFPDGFGSFAQNIRGWKNS